MNLNLESDEEWLRSEIEGAVMPPEQRERYRRILARLEEADEDDEALDPRTPQYGVAP